MRRLVLRLIPPRDTDGLWAVRPEKFLGEAAEKEQLRRTADQVFEQGKGRLFDATAREYAMRLSVADLRALVRFYSTPAAKRFQAVTPQVIAGTVESVGELDFKNDVRSAFCKDTGKLCAD